MRSRAAVLIAGALPVFVGATAMAQPAETQAPEKPVVAKPVDPAPCLAAIAISDDDRIVADCAAVIDSDATPSQDRIAALLARAAAHARRTEPDRAIADYTTALHRDPSLPDAWNARGELWRVKGDRPRAIADFSAALRVDPQHLAARANRKSLAQEVERIGAEMPLHAKPR